MGDQALAAPGVMPAPQPSVFGVMLGPPPLAADMASMRTNLASSKASLATAASSRTIS